MLKTFPAPRTTQKRGLFAIFIGNPVSFEINLSKPFKRAPPPANVIPLSTKSEETSGGVFSSAILITSIIFPTVSKSD